MWGIMTRLIRVYCFCSGDLAIHDGLDWFLEGFFTCRISRRFWGWSKIQLKHFWEKASYKYGRLVSGLCKATNRVLHVLCICLKLIYIDMFTFEVHTCAYIDIVIYIWITVSTAQCLASSVENPFCFCWSFREAFQFVQEKNRSVAGEKLHPNVWGRVVRWGLHAAYKLEAVVQSTF